MTGADLDEWLKAHGWRVSDFAAEIGYSRKAVHKWLSGRNRVPGDMASWLELLPRSPTATPEDRRRVKPEIRIEGDAAYIPLPCGREAVIDVADISVVGHLAWHSRRKAGLVYAVHQNSPEERDAGAVKFQSMHQLILPPQDGTVTDHKDGNGLNNRRSNLRYATHAQNMRNRRPNQGKELPKGVTAKGDKFSARIKVGDKQIEIGVYDTPGAAAAAYDRYALKLHGEFARPNNPAAKRELMDIIEDDDGYVPTEVVEPFEDGWSESRGGRGRRK